MKKLMFIDTNVLLAFYHLTSEDLNKLKVLTDLLASEELYLYLPEQVKQEFQRNREVKIADAMKILDKQKFNFSFPAMCKGYSAYKQLDDALKKCRDDHKSLVDALKRDIHNNALEADKTIKKVFEAAHFVEMTPKILCRARIRKELRNPPGKQDSIGDAVNWEALLDAVPKGECLYFISHDKDYQSSLDSDRFHPYLANEWKKEKEAEVYYYKELSLFFNKEYPDFPQLMLFNKREKDSKIENLANSPNFAWTHSAVAALKEYDNDFSQEQRNAIVEAVISNSQIYWIINDLDIREFIEELIHNRENEINSYNFMMLKELLEPVSEDIPDQKDIPDQYVSAHDEEDIPF